MAWISCWHRLIGHSTCGLHVWHSKWGDCIPGARSPLASVRVFGFQATGSVCEDGDGPDGEVVTSLAGSSKWEKHSQAVPESSQLLLASRGVQSGLKKGPQEEPLGVQEGTGGGPVHRPC